MIVSIAIELAMQFPYCVIVETATVIVVAFHYHSLVVKLVT
jgi:hypothetical protein